MLCVYRKSDGGYFRCAPAAVCKKKDGDLNPLLNEPDPLGDHCAIFEPWWNVSVDRILADDVSPNDLFAVSGYIASIMACTPTWRRLGVKMGNDQKRGRLCGYRA
jgi:hypothetical protein